MKPIELMLNLCDDQLVPILTPCSAASFKLKNILLPKIQRRVGFPRTENTMFEAAESKRASLSMAKTEHEIAL